VRDLALMLEALLYVYNPGGRALHQHQMRYFLHKYDEWVTPHSVTTPASEIDPSSTLLRRARGSKAYFNQGPFNLEECQRFARKYNWLAPLSQSAPKENFTARWSFVRTTLDREERHRCEVNPMSSRLVRFEHAEVRPIAEAKVQWYAFVRWFLDCAHKCPKPLVID
jgi:hypothetical protein